MNKRRKHSYILWFSVIFFILQFNLVESKDKPFVEILLNNNPTCNTTLENIAKAETWKFENEPNILITGFNFYDNLKNIKMFIDGKLFIEEKISVNNNKFKKRIKLNTPLKNQKPTIEIRIGEKFSQTFNLKLNKLYGNVQYFDGKPVNKPIVTAENICAIGDSIGNYEIYLPKKVKSVLVFDKNYSKSTLECYLWDVNLTRNTNLNISIDKLEVYQLHAWESFSSIYLHFIPMSVSRIKRVDKKILGNQKMLALQSDIWPEIEKNEIKVFVNQTEVPILTYCKNEDFLFKEDNELVTRPAYLISIPKVEHLGKIIKVQIQDSVKIEGRTIIEKGEGYYFGFY